jgi:GNAT superfamily N-acetyltransferase
MGTGAVVENEIYGVFVEPRMQGRGHGRTIMHELENRAIAKGHREVALSVSLPSRKFYEGLGYEILQEAHRDVGEGQQLDFWKARKSLE